MPAVDHNLATRAVVTRPAHLLRPSVLIVEDESRLRDLLSDVLPDMGFTASTARSGEEAVRIFEDDPTEIIMLDLQLPGMNGMKLFELIRLRWPDTQVVIMTGFGDLETARQAIRLDVVDFLTKPFHLRDVELALDRARNRLPRELPIADLMESEQASVLPPAGRTLAEAERDMILAALERHNGNRTAAALELGISRRKLHYWLQNNRG